MADRGGGPEFPISNQLLRVLEKPLKIASYGIPLWIVRDAIIAAAGEHTILDLRLNVALTFSLMMSAAAASLLGRVVSQSKRLRRQRQRIRELEAENEQLRGQQITEDPSRG